MRAVDFNEEKKEEKLQRALSREDDGESLGGRLLSMLSGEHEVATPAVHTVEAHENYTELSNIPQSGSASSERTSNREVV